MKLSRLDGKRWDVIVCGAGSAGVAAALAAADRGARTLLLERHGHGGGILTAAMIHTFDALKSCVDNRSSVVGGVATRLLGELERLDGFVTGDNPPEALVIHPEVYKVAIDQLLERAGVDVLFHAPVCGVLTADGRVAGVEAALKDGRARLWGGVVVDGTGDADVAHLAGAECSVAEDLQALTCHFRLGCVKAGLSWADWERVTRAAMEEAKAAGEIGVYGGPWIIRMHDDEISLNCTRVFGNPVDPVSLSAAEREGRAQVLRIHSILRKRAPGLEASRLLSGASQLHIRESRILRGAYQLTEEDIARGSRFEDSIAVGAWPVDIHPSSGFSGVHAHKEHAPDPYEIPFRCLVPERVDGLLVAGKPISTTHKAHGSTRVPGTSLATGEAAGAAAALAVRGGCAPRAVGAAELQATLAEGGAYPSRAHLPAGG